MSQGRANRHARNLAEAKKIRRRRSRIRAQVDQAQAVARARAYAMNRYFVFMKIH